MILIPGGSFTMGRTSGDTDSNAPPVTVTVTEFYMGKHEVTKALWDEVRAWGAVNGYTDLSVGGGKANNHPVHSITWFDMAKWCNARSQKEGLTPVYSVGVAVMKMGETETLVNWSANGYRLPTEAEWEKAARGGVSGKRYPWGSDTISHNEANFLNTGGESFQSGTTSNHPSYASDSAPYSSPVGSFRANGYGLYDMAGNVWERCWDSNEASKYVNGKSTTSGAASVTLRMCRGGSWGNNATFCRIASRGGYSPTIQDQGIGFRIARSSQGGEQIIEGEKLSVSSVTGGRTQIQNMRNWSNQAHLWWREANIGSELTIKFPVAAKGSYQLKGVLTKSWDYGNIGIRLDGKVLVNYLDCFNAGAVIRTSELDWGKYDLAEGNHTLTFTMLSANAEAKQRYSVFGFGLDYVKLIRVADQQTSNIRGNPLGDARQLPNSAIKDIVGTWNQNGNAIQFLQNGGILNNDSKPAGKWNQRVKVTEFFVTLNDGSQHIATLDKYKRVLTMVDYARGSKIANMKRVDSGPTQNPNAPKEREAWIMEYRDLQRQMDIFADRGWEPRRETRERFAELESKLATP